MPVYEYTALDKSGRSRKGIVNADTPRQAVQKLRASDLFPSDLRETTSERAKASGKKWYRWEFKSGRVRRADVVSAIRTLATLLGAGLPLVEALSGVLEQGSGASSGIGRVLSQVRERVTEGKSLAAAMSEHPAVFPPSHVAMVSAGEASGTLEAVMQQLADFGEQQSALRRKVQSTLAYPILMAVVGVGVVFFLMTYVIPHMTEIFTDMGQALPTPTIILMNVSGLLRQCWYLIILGAAGAWIAVRRYARSAAGRPRFDRFVLSLPLVGALVHRMIISRFSRTLATLLKNGVPLLSSLDIVRNVMGNAVFEAAIDDMRQEITEGESIVAPLVKHKLFPATALQMISAGEKSGRLEDMLFKVADIYESEVEGRLAVLTSLLEPIMILCLGVVVGFVVLAVLLPMFEMSQLVQ